MTRDDCFMRMALAQAAEAAAAGEVPVGAIVVKDGRVIASGRNAPIGLNDPTAHAEIVALRGAAQAVGNYRLDGCELFVTLEPCAMCSGAMLHARLARVVFGAPDRKTGAAGSVLDLFAQKNLNHHTQLCGGVLAQASSELLHTFFTQKRAEKLQARTLLHPLRDDALRTPDGLFESLADYPWSAHYCNDLPALGGLRMHYLDEGPVDASQTYLCLHGVPAWSYLYRKMIPVFLHAGARVVAPDLIGFGKSDKPKKEAAHRFGWHRQILLELVERLDLHNVVLVVQGWGGLLGLTLPIHAPQRYAGLLAMNTHLATGEAPLPGAVLARRAMHVHNADCEMADLFASSDPPTAIDALRAYTAPFPDKGHRSAVRAFSALVPEHCDSDGAAVSRDAKNFWQRDWHGKTLMAVGMQDPVWGVGTMTALQTTIRNCPSPLCMESSGHFVPEQGGSIAHAAIQCFGLCPGAKEK